MTEGKGSRIGGWKEKPKMASTMWSVSFRALGKSSVKGMLRLRSCVVSRYFLSEHLSLYTLSFQE